MASVLIDAVGSSTGVAPFFHRRHRQKRTTSESKLSTGSIRAYAALARRRGRWRRPSAAAGRWAAFKRRLDEWRAGSVSRTRHAFELDAAVAPSLLVCARPGYAPPPP